MLILLFHLFFIRLHTNQQFFFAIVPRCVTIYIHPMAKKTFQDVVPPTRSIRNIELPSRRQTPRIPDVPIRDESKKFEKKVEMRRVAPEITPTPTPTYTPPARSPIPPVEDKTNVSYNYTYDEPKKSSRTMLYVACVVLVVALAFGISAFFKSATITVTPRNETRTVSGFFTAQKDSTTGLGYQVVTVSNDVETQVAASGAQQVNTKATGTIVIYNNSGTAPQKLIATTRFQTSAGLVYRLNSAVTVPGRTGSGSSAVPGSVEAQVTADATGSSYNIGLSDFTLPALKGTPKFSTIYARSKTPMTGGFAGMEKVVSAADASSSNAVLQAQLESSLTTDIVSQIPANFIMYPADVTYSFSPATQATSATTTGDATAILDKKGTAQAIIFDKTALSEAIVAQVLPDATSSDVLVDNLDTLTFTYATSSTNTLNSISFNLTGSGHFVWAVDENALKSDLLGLSKVQAQALIAAKYPAIQEAWIETQPFWNTTIPLDANKVTLTDTLSK
jgi:hypothetical protein